MLDLITAGGDVSSDALNTAFREMLRRGADYDSIDIDESTTSLYSTAWVNLATRGPEVSLVSRGTRALIVLANRSWNTTAAANQCLMGVNITDDDGTVVQAPSLALSLINQGVTTRAAAKRCMLGFTLDLPEPGRYTYRAQYASGLGTANFGNRSIFVIAP